MPNDDALKEIVRNMYEASQRKVRSLTFSAIDRSAAWREAVAGLRAAVASVGRGMPDARDSGREA